MSESRVEPNPHSPYADANPEVRHIFPVPIFFPAPTPGALTPTGCERLAVVPEDVIEVPPGPLPDGLCAACIAAMRDEGQRDDRPVDPCRECGIPTSHDGLCALCRQDAHDQWWVSRTGGDHA